MRVRNNLSISFAWGPGSPLKAPFNWRQNVDQLGVVWLGQAGDTGGLNLRTPAPRGSAGAPGLGALCVGFPGEALAVAESH